MKLLLLFTLLSAACYGQDSGFYPKWAIQFPVGFQSVNPRDTVPYLQLSKSDEIVITVEKLFQYAQECWNDSTATFEPMECPDKIVGCLVFHARTVYIHRKPTFEGFIEWLKKK